MPNLPPKTHVADGACGCCGKTVHILLNKNGNAYYFCPWSDDQGRPCSHHERWGKAASQDFQRQYLKGRAANDNTAPSAPVAANDTSPPAVAANDDRAPETAGESLYDRITG